MKKVLTIVCAGALALMLVGCGSDKIVDESPDGTQVANPFSEYNTVEEAEKAAGFSIEVPDEALGYLNRTIRVLADSSQPMIEVIYYPASEEAGQVAQDSSGATTDQVCIRKAVGTGDISGDYNEYDDVHVEAGTGDAPEVTVKGNGTNYYLAVWEKDGYAYSVFASQGACINDILNLVDGVQ